MTESSRIGKWFLMHFDDDETGDRLSLGYGLKTDGKGATWYLLTTAEDGQQVEHAFHPRPRAVRASDLITWLENHLTPSNAKVLGETFAAQHPELLASDALR